MRILIVEDNPQMCEMIKLWLRDLTGEFAECADGTDALDAYRKYSPDWVLMDWEMKRMDGLTAIKEIIAEYPQAKILMVTMHDKAELKNAASAAGAKGFLLKDDLSTLRQIIGAEKYMFTIC